MVEYATILVNTFRNMLLDINLDYRLLIPGILIAGALVMVLIRLLKPPKV